MKILFAGIIARYPFGGVTWCSLMYLLGLRALGHEVFYIEDTGECVYDPVQNTRATDPVLRHHATSTTRSSRSASAIAGRSSTTTAPTTARSADEVRRYCADADLFINLSGGSWFWRDEYARIPRKVFIDSDPAFTQLAIAKAEPWYVEFFQRFDHLFTFGANIGTPASPVPTGELHVAQDLAAGRRSTTGAPTRAPRDRFTTVMTWQIESFADVGGNKDQEFVKFIDLPSRTPQPLRARDQRPADSCCASTAGTTVDAMSVSRTLWDYRDFIQRLEGRVRRRQAHLRRDAAPAGSAIAPSATSRRAARRSCRTPAGPRTCRPARACSRSRRPTRRSPGIDRINGDYAAPRAARRRDRARALRRRRACCRALLDDGLRMTPPLRDRARRAGRDDDSAAASRARSRR